MVPNVQMDVINGITVVTPTDELTLRICFKVVDYLASHYPFQRRLWDLRDSKVAMKAIEFSTLAAYASKKFQGPSKLAVITAKEDARTNANLRMALEFTPPDHFEVMIFSDLEDAMGWIGRAGDAP